MAVAGRTATGNLLGSEVNTNWWASQHRTDASRSITEMQNGLLASLARKEGGRTGNSPIEPMSVGVVPYREEKKTKTGKTSRDGKANTQVDGRKYRVAHLLLWQQKKPKQWSTWTRKTSRSAARQLNREIPGSPLNVWLSNGATIDTRRILRPIRVKCMCLSGWTAVASFI